MRACVTAPPACAPDPACAPGTCAARARQHRAQQLAQAGCQWIAGRAPPAAVLGLPDQHLLIEHPVRAHLQLRRAIAQQRLVGHGRVAAQQWQIELRGQHLQQAVLADRAHAHQHAPRVPPSRACSSSACCTSAALTRRVPATSRRAVAWVMAAASAPRRGGAGMRGAYSHIASADGLGSKRGRGAWSRHRQNSHGLYSPGHVSKGRCVWRACAAGAGVTDAPPRGLIDSLPLQHAFGLLRSAQQCTETLHRSRLRAVKGLTALSTPAMFHAVACGPDGWGSELSCRSLMHR